MINPYITLSAEFSSLVQSQNKRGNRNRFPLYGFESVLLAAKPKNPLYMLFGRFRTLPGRPVTQ